MGVGMGVLHVVRLSDRKTFENQFTRLVSTEPLSFGLATRTKFNAFAGAAFRGTFEMKLCTPEKQPSLYGRIIADASPVAESSVVQ